MEFLKGMDPLLHRKLKMHHRIWISALITMLLFGVGFAARIVPSGYTKIVLTQEGKSGKLFSAVAPDGERLTLSWRNSLFGLQAKEGFFARSGVLIQDQVIFFTPDGAPPPRVSPEEVDDLYQTGGAFDARGLSRSFSRIVYRIGEIGDPKLHVQGRTVAFKQAAGFGGRIILTTSRPALYEILGSW